jgi:uncharacterized protein YgiM (DUF1202 family)
MRIALVGMLLLAAQSVWAAETGTALKAETLRAKPFADAKAVASLAAGARVSILKKDGGWLQVKSGKSTGWVRMLSIRKGDAAKPAASGKDVSGLLGLASGRAGTGKVVSTTGVRGLNEEELKAAKFDEKEVEKAESYATSSADARSFSAQGKLKARPFDYLPNP